MSTSHDAQAALLQVLGGLMLLVLLLLLVACVTAVVVRVKARRASRARLAAMPVLSPEALDAGRQRLLAVIPAQRTGAGQ